MFSTRNLSMITVALLLALGSVLLAKRWLDRVQPVHEPVVETTPVVVAAADIAYLSKIKPADVKVMQMPKSFLPLDASVQEGVRTSPYLQDPAEAIGKVVTQTIYANEPLVKKRLRDNLGGNALAHVVAPSMRAISVRVDDVSGVSGFLLPNNRVDVLTTTRTPGESGDEVETHLLVQDVKVLAVDQEASQEKEGAQVVRAVTLELTPDQAARIMLASEVGSLRLTLRNPLDVVTINQPEIHFSPKKRVSGSQGTEPKRQLDSSASSANSSQPKKCPEIIRTVLQGGKSVEYRFPTPGCIEGLNKQ